MHSSLNKTNNNHNIKINKKTFPTAMNEFLTVNRRQTPLIRANTYLFSGCYCSH